LVVGKHVQTSVTNLLCERQPTRSGGALWRVRRNNGQWPRIVRGSYGQVRGLTDDIDAGSNALSTVVR